MRVFVRFTEILGDSLFDAGRYRMFQKFRFAIDFAPIETEYFGQEQFDQSMPSDNSERFAQTFFRQFGTAARFVFDPLGIAESLQHARNGRRPDFQLIGNFDRRNEAVGPPQPMDGLEVILHGRGRLLSQGSSRLEN